MDKDHDDDKCQDAQEPADPETSFIKFHTNTPKAKPIRKRNPIRNMKSNSELRSAHCLISWDFDFFNAERIMGRKIIISMTAAAYDNGTS
jgi:hypothetical protein